MTSTARNTPPPGTALSVTAADAINAAADVIDGITSGTLSPVEVQRRAVSTARELFGVVGAGPADPLWTLHGDVARQYLAAGGVSVAELIEWTSCQQRREGITEPEPGNGPPTLIPSVSGTHSVGNGHPGAEPLGTASPVIDAEPMTEPEAVAADA